MAADEDPAAYEKFLRDQNVIFLTYRDPSIRGHQSPIGLAYGTSMYPETYIIDRRGKFPANMDVGWSKTAAIWGAHDRDNDVAYLTGEHYRGQAEPVIHAEAIKARGLWMRGFIDPAANGRSQIDGRQLLQIYRGLGLTLQMAENAREAGIYEVWMRLSTVKLKVFRSCRNWLDEFRIFARDENGKIINEQKFHLMAATRYLFMGGMISRWTVNEPPSTPRALAPFAFPTGGDSGWMA